MAAQTIFTLGLNAAWNGSGVAPVNSTLVIVLPQTVVSPLSASPLAGDISTWIGAVIIQIAQIFVGTLQFEYTVNGNVWFPLTAIPFAGGHFYSGVAVTSATAPGEWLAVLPAGATQIRIRMSAFTSGVAAILAVVATAAQAIAGQYFAISPISMAG